MTILLSFIAGLIFLTVGAEFLIRGASRIAIRVGISPLVVGLTVVAFGTSAPELFISARSALAGQSDIALGNVVGSNIFNVLFILGLCALIAPLAVRAQLIRLDVPIMIGASVLLLLIALDGVVGRFDGAILVLCLASYTYFTIQKSRNETAAQKEFEAELNAGDSDSPKSPLVLVGLIIIGLVLLVFGARLFVNASIDVARIFGVSELVIALTIVSIGTSLPEVATSVVATYKGERDIAIGNVVGSNIFNIFCVLGVTSIIAPVAVSPAVISLDLPIMLAVAIACLPIFYTGFAILRWEGALFLGYYLIYVLFLILSAAEHSATVIVSEVMLAFILPLTAATLLVLSHKEWNRKPK